MAREVVIRNITSSIDYAKIVFDNIKWFLFVAGSLLIAILIKEITYIKSIGNKKRVSHAKNNILTIKRGIIIILALYFIVAFIEYILDI